MNKLLILILTLILLAVSVSANSVQIGSTIYIADRHNLTEVSADIANTSALNQTETGIWLLNTNLINNNTANSFYLNETDVTWLKINSTNTSGTPTYWYYLTNGKTEINNTKITSWNTTSNTVEDLPASTWARSAVYASGASSKMNISNSNLSYLGYSGTNLYGVSYITSSGNSITNSSFLENYKGILLHTTSTNNILTSNTVNISTNDNGIQISSNSNNNTLVSNKITASTSGIGIFIGITSNNNILTSNTGTSNTGFGIQLSGSSLNNTLTSNTGTSNTNYGIYLLSSSNNTLTSNTGTSSTGNGIYLSSSSNNTLTSNTATSTSGNGIALITSSNYNTLTSNTGTSNTVRGIYLEYSSNNNLTSNIGTSNTNLGIQLYSASDNKLTSNTFNTNSTTASIADILIRTSSRNNTFINTSFTKPRKITFYNALLDEFNQSQDGGISFVNTNVSIARVTNRSISNWTQTNITFTETFTGATQANYSATGLLPSVDYRIYNGTSNDFNYTTDASGTLTPFTINFSTSATTVKILQQDFTPPTIDFISPTDTNGTTVGRNYTFVNTSVSDIASPNNLTGLINFDNSLAGWWRFNEGTGTTTTDYSGYGNTGTLTSMNTGLDNCAGNCSGWNSSGKFGNAIAFDGVNDYINAGNGASLLLFGGGRNNITTIEAWIKTNTQGVAQTIIGSDVNYGFQFRIATGNYLEFVQQNIAVVNSTTNTIGTNWTYVAVSYNNNGNYNLYINGLSSLSGTNLKSFNSSQTIIGGRNISGVYSQLFNGTIDEVRIYNRALSAEEISASYNAGLNRLYHNFTNLADGTHNYTAYVEDLAGNVNSTAKQYVTIDAIYSPTITLLSQTPSTISQNTTGLLNQSWGITHSTAGLNNSSIALVHSMYDILLGTRNHSIRPPSNNKSAIWSVTGERILRATNRNETLTFENNATITGGNIYEWGGEDYNSSNIHIVPVNTTYTIIYFNNSISSTANANMWYLDRTDMQSASKTQFKISKGVSAMVKFWDLKTIVLPIHIITVNIDTSLAGTPSGLPVEIYYLNNSFNPVGAVQPEVSPYSHFITTLNATQWTNHIFTPTSNASYITLTFNTSSIIDDGITPTTMSYLYFKSDAKLVDAYQINVTNVTTSTNVTFANTSVMWTGKDAPFTPYSYTPNIYFSFTHPNQRFDSKLFVADNDGMWGNSTLQSINIDVSAYPPDTPNIDHFHYPTLTDFDYDMNLTYSGTFNIGVGVASDPDGGIVTHNLTLWYSNRTYIATINNTFTNLDVTHDNVYADISFNTTPYLSSINNYTLKVVATDDEGLTSESWLKDNFTLTDTTPPTAVTLLTPTNGDHTNDNTPAFDWTDATDTYSSLTYTLQIANDTVFTDVVQNISDIVPSTYTITTPLSDGAYYWRVRATDSAGNSGNWSDEGYFNVTIDTLSPDWILNNYPKADNSTRVESSIPWDVKVYDTNLYRIYLNITNSTGYLMESNYTDNYNETWLNYSHTTDVSTWSKGNYTVELSATDDHTYGSLRGLLYSTESANISFYKGSVSKKIYMGYYKNGEYYLLTPAQRTAFNISFNIKDTGKGEYKYNISFKRPATDVFFGIAVQKDDIIIRNASIGHILWREWYMDFQDMINSGFPINFKAIGNYYVAYSNTTNCPVPAGSICTIDPVIGGLNTATEYYNIEVVTYPDITSYSNTKTGTSLTLKINKSESVTFSAVANQTISTWNWYKDNAAQSNNYDNISLSWDTSGIKTVTVNATNYNGTSNTITWNIIIPPSSISGLSVSATQTSLTANWTNPTDATFSHVSFYKDGIFYINTSGTSYTFSNLNVETYYTISTYTSDTNYYSNVTWTNTTVRTMNAQGSGGGKGKPPSVITTPPPSVTPGYTAPIFPEVPEGTYIEKFIPAETPSGLYYTKNPYDLNVYKISVNPPTYNDYVYIYKDKDSNMVVTSDTQLSSVDITFLIPSTTGVKTIYKYNGDSLTKPQQNLLGITEDDKYYVVSLTGEQGTFTFNSPPPFYDMFMQELNNLSSNIIVNTPLVCDKFITDTVNLLSECYNFIMNLVGVNKNE